MGNQSKSMLLGYHRELTFLGNCLHAGSPYWIKKWKDLIYSTIYESSPTNSSRSDFLAIDIRDESKAAVSSSAG